MGNRRIWTRARSRPQGADRPGDPSHRKRRGRSYIALGVVVLLLAAGMVVTFSDLVVRSDNTPQEIHSRRGQRFLRSIMSGPNLDGSGNNRENPDWGQVGTEYSRVAEPNYSDGVSAPGTGPNSRAVSNRVFNDVHQNIFSENDVTQWGFVWGQFVDHTFGLRDAAGEDQNIGFDTEDPLEEFTNTLGAIPFTRSAAAPGTGEDTPRQQTNTVSSYIDAWAVYGGSEERLEWMREGPLDGDLSNNSALLRLPEDYLPRRDSLGDASTAPEAEVNGRLTGTPERATVAGDMRSNENIALTATHTLFAREHNRIVGLLPDNLSEQQKFQIARRVVMAEQQYITFNEFLPTLGVELPQYDGYDPTVNASLGNEFATVGYRAHSMVHGEIEVETDADRYTPEDLAALEAQGVEVELSEDGLEVVLIVPLNVAFFNPDLVEGLQLGPLLQGIGLEAQYQNDEQIDNQLRSVLFEIPVSENPECLDGEGLPECFQGVVDLGAVDIERGRDHGIPSYNELREAYGLPPVTSFTEITGEDSEEFPSDPELTPGDEVNDPDSLDFVELRDGDGNIIDPIADPDAAEGDVVTATRRTPLAARLAAVYGSVDEVDAFVGMLSEAHVDGADFGELQLAVWTQQFQALRDGDRYYYDNQSRALDGINRFFGIDFHVSLGDVIANNTDIPREELADNVFVAAEEEAVPAPEEPAPVEPAPEEPPADGTEGAAAAALLAVLPGRVRPALRRRLVP